MQAVSLKILAHGASRRELEVMQKLAQVNPDHPTASSHVVQLLDHFEYQVTNGTHLCLVLELMWQDVQGFVEGYRDSDATLRFPVVKIIAKQVVEGLEYLHRSGVIHNGRSPFMIQS
jgi:serine/threonine-protein kinase SRPK3